MADPFDLNPSDLPTGYIQTAPLLVSGRISVPPKTKRIEAMLCGGGMLGFGGCQIYEIPLSGPQLTYVVGAGGGGMSTVSCAGTVLAAVGGVFAAGGHGGGGPSGSGSPGYPPFNAARMLWSALDFAPKTGTRPGSLISTVAPYPVVQLGMGGINDGTSSISLPCDAYLGWGGGGAQGGNAGPGNVGGSGGSGSQGGSIGGGAAGGNGGAGACGGNGGSGATSPGGNGGSLASISMWGLTGFGGGTGASGGANRGAGGGGGMLGAGANGSGTTAGAGGLGGGGGNPGGAGFIMFRFYY